MTRDPARVRYPIGDRVGVVEGDVRDRMSVVRAMAGVDTVVSAVHGFAGPGGVSPASVDRDGNANLIDAAAQAGAAVVLMSVVGASADNPMELHRMKHAAEQHLRASGISWTIVRPTAYMETWIDVIVQTARRSGRPVVFGRAENPINFVSASDVAALVERAITDASTRGKALDIGGPQDLTFEQLARAVQEAAGRTKEPRHVPRIALRTMGAVMGRFKPELARQARAALVMDSADMTFDSSAIHHAFPDLPSTTLSEVLASGAVVAHVPETGMTR
jgi:NADH dehydrogenase